MRLLAWLGPPNNSRWAVLLAHVIVIASANGILMQRERLTGEGAFQLFVGLHNVATRRLGNVAAGRWENLDHAARQTN